MKNLLSNTFKKSQIINIAHIIKNDGFYESIELLDCSISYLRKPCIDKTFKDVLKMYNEEKMVFVSLVERIDCNVELYYEFCLTVMKNTIEYFIWLRIKPSDMFLTLAVLQTYEHQNLSRKMIRWHR